MTKNKSKKLKVNTFLPCFNGFHGTIFDIDNEGDYSFEVIQEYLASDFKEDYPDLVKDQDNVFEVIKYEFFGTEEYQNAYEEWSKEVIEHSIHTVLTLLKELQMVDNIIFEKLYSPREYNFANDHIDVFMTFTPKNIQNIKDFISKHKKIWDKHILDNYTSGSGFFSNFSNDSDSVEWDIDNAIKNSHQCGAILEFIIYIVDEDIQEDMIDEIYMNVDVKTLIQELIDDNKITVKYFSVANENDDLLYDNGDRYCDKFERQYCLKTNNKDEARLYITDHKNQRVVVVDDSGNILE